MKLSSDEVRVLGDYLASLRLNGRHWQLVEDNALDNMLSEILPDDAFRIGLPESMNMLECSSVFILDPKNWQTTEAVFDQISQSNTRPLLIFVNDALTLDAPVERYLIRLGYQLPPKQIAGTSIQSVEHTEYDHKSHFDVAGYWEARYASGRDSGTGSYGRLAIFKARVLNDFVRRYEVKSVLELGCGDGAQLALTDYPNYTGLDISKTAVERCRTIFQGDQTKRFEVYDPSIFDPGTYNVELGLSLDVVYHLANDEGYRHYLQHLFLASSRFVIIYSNTDRSQFLGVDESAGYIRFRDVLSDIKHYHPDWSLVSAIPNRFPYSALNPANTSFSDFFVFEKQIDEQSPVDSDVVIDRLTQRKVFNSLIIVDESAKRIFEKVEYNARRLDKLTYLTRELTTNIDEAVKKINESQQETAAAKINRDTELLEQVNTLYSAITERLERIESAHKLSQRSPVDDPHIQAPDSTVDAEFRSLDMSLNHVLATYQRLQQHAQNLESSTSYRAGRALVDAFKNPGKATLRLPARLLHAFRSRGREVTSTAGPTALLERARASVIELRKLLGNHLDQAVPPSAWIKGILLNEEPCWFSLSVVDGAAVNIEGSLHFLGSGVDSDKSVVMLIECLDANGKRVLGRPSKLAYSDRMASYFKYVTSTKNPVVIHGFVPPPKTHRVLVGFCMFHASDGTQYILDNLAITAGITKRAQPVSELHLVHGSEESVVAERVIFESPSPAAQEISILGWPEPPQNHKPLVLAVMDEFTEGCFSSDLRLLQPRPDNWYALANKYPPDFVFVESAWKGNGGCWQYRVASYSHKPGNELEEMLAWARQQGIPTIFWNKEDPVHHDKFMVAASHADHIFTTDENMVESYKSRTGKNSVQALPFAAQPSLHKPAPLHGRVAKACFAGSWYGNRHAERRDAMKWLLSTANKYGLDIFDRNYGTGVFPFPDQYREGIRGSLSYLELCKEYQRYRLFLNVNSVSGSPTMFSRRVFELLASGTPVVSTYAQGIESMIEGDVVWLVNNEKEADEAIHTLLTDDKEWRRRSLSGIRDVFSRHTYAHRLNQIFDVIGLDLRIPINPSVLLVASAFHRADLECLMQFVEQQQYMNFRLFIECAPNCRIEDPPEQVELFAPNTIEQAIQTNAEKYAAVGRLNPQNSYGKYFIQDLVNASVYQPSAKGWGKACEHDVFAYSEKTFFSSTLWRPTDFLQRWLLMGDHIVSSDDLYVADADEFTTGRSMNDLQNVSCNNG